MVVKVGDLSCNLVDELIKELPPLLAIGKEDGQATTFIHKKSLDLEAIDVGCDDD